MADFVHHRSGDPDLERTQRLSRENHERNVPAMVRDGKDIPVFFSGGSALTIPHGLGRKPRGWLIHSAGRPNSASDTGASPYAILEVFSDEREIRLVNNYGGAGDLVAMLWVW